MYRTCDTGKTIVPSHRKSCALLQCWSFDGFMNLVVNNNNNNNRKKLLTLHLVFFLFINAAFLY